MNSTEQIRNLVLHPGEVHIGDARDRVITLLGSCVSITLWHPQKQIGAMSHYLLSTRGTPQRRSSPSAQLDGRYGDEAILLMFEGLRARGVAPAECVAKVFGGGHMFAGLWQNEARDIGRKNGDAAHAMLRSLHIPIVSESLYGERFRKIYFEIASGFVWASKTPPDRQQSPHRLQEAFSTAAPRYQPATRTPAGQAGRQSFSAILQRSARACHCGTAWPCAAHSN